MSEPTTPNQDPFAQIMPEDLETVSGGATSRSSDDQLTAMLTSITSSIKDLANKNNQTDPMQMMLMMMLMMGGGGGGGGVVQAGGYGYGAGGAMPVINVDTSLAGGGGGCFGVPICRGKGKKGW